jgi:hypothetical protein
MTISEWIYQQTEQTHTIALPRLFTLLYNAMIQVLELDTDRTRDLLLQDHAASGIKGQAKFLQQKVRTTDKINKGRSESRQKRHRAQ